MFLSIVFFITGLLGFLTVIVMISQYKTNRKVNFYLLVVFLFVSCRFFISGIHILIPFSIDGNLIIVFQSFICAIFSCIYLYFNSLFADKKNIVKDDLYHFVIPVLFGFLNIFVRKYIPFLHFYVYFLFSGIVLFYMFLSYVALKNKVWFRHSGGAIVDKEKILLRNWTLFFFSVCVLCVIRLLGTLFLDVYVAGYSNGLSYLWVSAVLSCVLFFKILLTPDMLLSYPDIGYRSNSRKSDELFFDDFWILTDEEVVVNDEDWYLKEIMGLNLLSYLHEIERMALEQLCFREVSFSLGDFALKLGIPKNHLIYLFKYHAIVSFVEFKKAVQIYDSIGLIEQGFLKSNTLDSLSKKTGFSSYSPFLTSFTEVTGVVPQEYENMKK